MAKLIILCGLPGSGKSYYAEKGNLKIVFGAEELEETTARTFAALGIK